MAEAYAVTLKKSIKPVTFTIEVIAKKVNENGTFSGIEFVSVKSLLKNSSIKVSSPPQAGGAMFLKCDTLEGLEFIEGTLSGGKAADKVKLF